MTGKWMIQCEKATELIDKRSASGISFSEWLQLKLHTAMCDACRSYQKQSKFLDKILGKKLKETDDAVNNTGSNEDLKKRIISKL